MRILAAISLVALAVAGCNRSDEETPGAAAGQPCPALAADQLARGLDLGSGASLNGVGVARERGASSCRVEGQGVACEMTDPGVVGVTPAEGAQAAYFEIPTGRNASITVSGGQARCTLS